MAGQLSTWCITMLPSLFLSLLPSPSLFSPSQLLDIDASSSVNLGKGCVMLAGLYAFYLLEFVLHSFTGHSHVSFCVGVGVCVCLSCTIQLCC